MSQEPSPSSSQFQMAQLVGTQKHVAWLGWTIYPGGPMGWGSLLYPGPAADGEGAGIRIRNAQPSPSSLHMPITP